MAPRTRGIIILVSLIVGGCLITACIGAVALGKGFTWGYDRAVKQVTPEVVVIDESDGNGTSGSQDGSSPVDSAVGATSSTFVKDETEGACNRTVNPTKLREIAEKTRVLLTVQWHGRCVVVIGDKISEQKYHTITGGLNASEIGLVDPAKDKIHPNAPCAPRKMAQGGYLLNLYFEKLTVDQNKVADLCK